MFSFMSCMDRERIVDKSKLTGRDYRLFQQTPAWELAKAVEDEDTLLIKSILTKQPYLVNSKDSIYGETLLMITILRHQWYSFAFLLSCGANINVYESLNGLSPLLLSCRYADDTKYISELLRYGADPNDKDKVYGYSALIHTVCSSRLDFLDLLLSKGANIDYVSDYGTSVLGEALLLHDYKIALYLLHHGVNFKNVLYFRPDATRVSEDNGNENKIPVFILDKLREDIFPIGSVNYKHKMLVVDFLKKKGVDYRSYPIPEYTLELIKQQYPQTWQQYIEIY